MNEELRTMKVKLMNVEEERKSPYAVGASEELVKLTASHGRTIQLNHTQEEIIKVLNEYLVLNTWLLASCLEMHGVYISQSDLQRELWFLSANEYIDKYKMQNCANGREYNCYKVGRRGKAWLLRLQDRAYMFGYLEDCNLLQLKKILVANQTLISLGLNQKKSIVQNCKIVKCKPFLWFGKDFLFRATGMVQNESELTIVEPVRSGYEEFFQRKLERMEKILRKNRTFNKNLKRTVIVVAESEQQMQELQRSLENKIFNSFIIEFYYDYQLIRMASALNINSQHYLCS